MRAEVPAVFDCRATAAVLRSGGTALASGHMAALLDGLSLWKGTNGSWIALSALLVWCGSVYLGIRVNIDARLFDLLAEASGEAVDAWLEVAGLRKTKHTRSLTERRHGALCLWRWLLVCVAVEIALTIAAVIVSMR